jgi:hypothetical protein
LPTVGAPALTGADLGGLPTAGAPALPGATVGAPALPTAGAGADSSDIPRHSPGITGTLALRSAGGAHVGGRGGLLPAPALPTAEVHMLGEGVLGRDAALPSASAGGAFFDLTAVAAGDSDAERPGIATLRPPD